jgi:hypothetical protein
MMPKNKVIKLALMLIILAFEAVSLFFNATVNSNDLICPPAVTIRLESGRGNQVSLNDALI